MILDFTRLIKVALLTVPILFSGCYVKERVEELIGRPEAENTRVRARNAKNITVDCCLCYLNIMKENEISPYMGKDLCEGLDTTRNANCRKVKVLGGGCSFLNVSGARGALDCDVRPVKYIEDGVIKEVLPPNSDIGPCYQERAVAALEDVEQAPDQKSAKGQPEAKCRWVCGPSTRSGYCEARVYISERPATIETLPKPDGGKCDRNSCMGLFGDRFYGLCPNFSDDQLEK